MDDISTSMCIVLDLLPSRSLLVEIILSVVHTNPCTFSIITDLDFVSSVIADCVDSMWLEWVFHLLFQIKAWLVLHPRDVTLHAYKNDNQMKIECKRKYKQLYKYPCIWVQSCVLWIQLYRTKKHDTSRANSLYKIANKSEKDEGSHMTKLS